MATVRLELVGVYFREDLDLPDPGTSRSVKDIMDLGIQQFGNSTSAGGFDYMTDSTSNPMQVIRHNFGGGVTRSGKNRMAGIYELREDRSNLPVVQAWQYYVLDADNNRVSATGGGAGFDSFIDATFNFDDQWKVIWRLVSILREPNVAGISAT